MVGAAATFISATAARAEISSRLIEGAMKGFTITAPPKEMRSLDQLQAEMPRDRFLVLPISLDGSTKGKVAPFYKERKLTNLGIFYDKGRKAMSVLGVTLLPTSILVDPAGRELGRLEGDADWDTPEGIALMRAAL
jgi:hypothetical protein